ncbi:MAG: class B sortase [Oscillospiraceae bacterium]|nr:class B sortase [Oscillospiraceae bacterium]
MAIADEVRKPQHFKETAKKKKKSFREAFIPSKNDSSKELFSKVFSLFSLLVLVVCIGILGVYFYHQFEAKQNNEDIRVIYNNAVQDSVVTTQPAPQQPANPEEETQEIVRQPLVVSSAAEEMLAINPNYAGYLYIPDVMSEAVVKYTDNDYYLNHNIYDQKRSCGTVFADFRNTVNDYSDRMSDNIILYGHNQKDGTMFGNMDYYKWDYKYWLKNPFIYFDNLYESGTYVIISSFVINTEPEHDNGNVFDYNNFINFKSEGPYTYENFIKEITDRSHFITGIDVNEEDKFLTLSTCTYEWEPARHVIVARRLRPGETTDSIDTTNFSVNSNPKWPAIYYKYNGGSYVEQ